MDISKVEKEDYQKLVDEVSPKSNSTLNCIRAFWVGGSICLIGQIINTFFTTLNLSEDMSSTMTSISLILLSIIFTCLGFYGKLGSYAGAGSMLPITGFANAIASPALEFKKEGMILGLGAKIFVLAGPVIVYGLVTSSTLGLFYYILNFVL